MQAVKDSGAECIVHTAALLGASVNQAPYTGFKVNVDGTVNVVMAARFTGVKRSCMHAHPASIDSNRQPR